MPSPSLFFPKSSDQNFGIAVLFILVERPNSCALGYKIFPIARGERSLSYKIMKVAVTFLV